MSHFTCTCMSCWRCSVITGAVTVLDSLLIIVMTTNSHSHDNGLCSSKPRAYKAVIDVQWLATWTGWEQFGKGLCLRNKESVSASMHAQQVAWVCATSVGCSRAGPVEGRGRLQLRCEGVATACFRTWTSAQLNHTCSSSLTACSTSALKALVCSTSSPLLHRNLEAPAACSLNVRVTFGRMVLYHCSTLLYPGVYTAIY